MIAQHAVPAGADGPREETPGFLLVATLKRTHIISHGQPVQTIGEIQVHLVGMQNSSHKCIGHSTPILTPPHH